MDVTLKTLTCLIVLTFAMPALAEDGDSGTPERTGEGIESALSAGGHRGDNYEALDHRTGGADTQPGLGQITAPGQLGE